MMTGLGIFAKGLGVMVSKDETVKADPGKADKGRKSDRAQSAANPPKFLWDKEESIETQGLIYTIEKNLATGGFGNTYKAWDNKKNKWVVLKMPTPRIWKDLGSEECQKIFREEGDRLGGFKFSENPHLVTYETRFQLPDGLPVIVMEYVEGENLWDRIGSQGSVSEQRALNYIHQLSQGVRALHQAKLYHRDIKPENIILKVEEDTETLVLVDFGISREAEATDTASGTPRWASAEQRSGTKPCYSHDVYAIAKILYWLITGIDFDELEPQRFADKISQETYAVIETVTENTTGIRTIINRGKEEQRTVPVLKNRLTLDEFLSRLPKEDRYSSIEIFTDRVPEVSVIPPLYKPVSELTIALEKSQAVETIPTAPTAPTAPEDLVHPVYPVPLPKTQPSEPIVSEVLPDRKKSGLLKTVKAIVLPLFVSPALAIFIILGLGWFHPLLGPPVPVEEKNYSTFNNSTFKLSYNPDLWEDKTEALDPFRDRIVTYLSHPVDDSLVISIEQHPNTFDVSLPKSAQDVKNETIIVLDQSLKTVTYFDSKRSLQVQRILVPVETETYQLIYAAPPDRFADYADEALAVFASLEFVPTPSQNDAQNDQSNPN